MQKQLRILADSVFAQALSWVVLLAAPWMGEAATRDTALAAKLLPEPRELVVGDSALALAGRTLAADLPVEEKLCIVSRWGNSGSPRYVP